MMPCPVCGWPGGFHDTDNKQGSHASHQVPREVLLESGWAKEAHEQFKLEQAEKRAAEEAKLEAQYAALDEALKEEQMEVLEEFIRSHPDYQDQMDAIAAEIPDDMQARASVIDDRGHLIGEVLIKGTKPQEA